MQRVVGSLDGADLGVLAAYFVVVFAVGIWVSNFNRCHFIILVLNEINHVSLCFSHHAETVVL